MKLLRVPPLTTMSARLKSTLDLLRVKVMMGVSPALSAVLLVLMAMVGSAVSEVKVTKLLASAPSVLRLPAASLKALEATCTVPLADTPGVGVKVAV